MAEQGGGGRNPGWIPTDDDAAAACSMALQTVVRISLLRLGTLSLRTHLIKYLSLFYTLKTRRHRRIYLPHFCICLAAHPLTMLSAAPFSLFPQSPESPWPNGHKFQQFSNPAIQSRTQPGQYVNIKAAHPIVAIVVDLGPLHLRPMAQFALADA